ncbi:hypothetical protein [Reinekea sp. G2M2-21]|uniref:hypothetical protein n=1 Tax=Reinekea sp. G2M2-21 TaxID=2788942 RepID=UPI0018AA9600|nr:hypothetical protein [Reinekea sp. G2M2-21]
MAIDKITLEGVQLRRKVEILVESDFNQAYKVARSIRHPWYKCQSLSKVSEFASSSSIESLLLESFDSAMKCHDENRRVSVACWPIKVSLHSGKTSLAKAFLDECISQLNSDKDPVSRWCAVSVVNTIKSDLKVLEYFYDTLESVTSKGHGWRIERSINQLLSDPEVQKDKRYIKYLTKRLVTINSWKKANARQR